MGELQIKDATREKLGLITPEELAAALEVTTTTLQTWRVQDYGPRFVKLGKGVFYRYSEIQEWIAECLQPRSPDPVASAELLSMPTPEPAQESTPEAA